MDTNGHTILNEDYVSFEVAKLLKEKGFDISLDSKNLMCCMYDENGNIHWGVYDKNWYFRITHQMAMKWLREIHNKHCDVGYDIDLKWFFQIIDLKETVEDHYTEMKTYHSNNQCNFKSFEEAVKAALKYCLENLI